MRSGLVNEYVARVMNSSPNTDFARVIAPVKSQSLNFVGQFCVPPLVTEVTILEGLKVNTLVTKLNH
jgi:hypothetical protein